MSATNSNPKKSWSTLHVAIAGLCFALAGYWCGKKFSVTNVDDSFPASAKSPTVKVSHRASELSPTERWDRRWRDAVGRPNSPTRIRELETMLEELARTDPQRALALALAEPNWLARDKLRNAALRGWGAVAPDAAAEWALQQPQPGDRLQSVCAVLTGAAENPEEAVRVGLKLCGTETSPAGDYGHALINALVEKTGSFAAAARFAVSAKMVDRQSFLLDSAFYQWAQHEPDRALAEFSKIADPNVRSAALKGVIAGWADSDPHKLADFAQALPKGDDRSRALEIALPQWVGKDPEAALQWMNSVEPDPDFDKGIAALAFQSSFHRRPEAAMEITDNITDSAKRVLTKSNVFYQWAIRDFDAAKRYAETNPNAEERTMLLEDLATLAASKAAKGLK